MKDLLEKITVKRLHEIILREDMLDISSEEIDLLARIALKCKHLEDEPDENEGAM